ncbi:aminotransferase class I/II-fold pyridoxal phosphate-dependent enzyme [Aquincola sp. S2]|uniref:Aminotransferase class I/II-fold pyridoxal phosphate-dependent enzyme n=1 Tax=Pseudaquabacterium terrae TaxID=2732868 RepID=A0ABX2EGR1_9BURK|nr:aminotransferase class I/II-fold pyridoxal phosphate-dependent enzyme [Aquabacterium terrae]NRF67808.1 aminotransferase class I/II-fold pyridoxal phosphate-dependent enzyme [Aquabacterium terrae]
MARKLRTKPYTSLNRYHSVWEMRADGWINLTDDLGRLVDLGSGTPEFRERQARVKETLEMLLPIESYWAFPGKRLFGELCGWFAAGELARLHSAARRINRLLASNAYRHQEPAMDTDGEIPSEIDTEEERLAQIQRPYFEVLIVDEMSTDEEEALRRRVHKKRRPDDAFIFDIVVVPSFEDALIAVLFNINLQACVIRHGFPFKSEYQLDLLGKFLDGVDEHIECLPESERGPLLGAKISEVRPELDLYLVTDIKAEEIAIRVGDIFKRVFFREEDHTELYMAIMRGVGERFRTPFFTALVEYSKQPTGVFHALPIARAKSVVNSSWIQDLGQFYGMNLFMAETSATSGGLDSLLDPVGPIKLAQEYAARAFGARRTFFATNGTSTANKIVVQAMVQPHDIVLVDRNCHKSHHYGMVLAGAQVAYLDSYPLNDYSMYGAVPIAEIKRTLLRYRRAGLLDRVKMVLLTNCTFDGVVYDVERVMEECLAIKPNLIFLWDEAWFAFARFHPTYRRRTGMSAAARLHAKYQSASYADRYQAFSREFAAEDWNDEEKLVATRLLPDPAKVRIRVYATQSTHKTLTSLRQGSMIHVWDQDFKDKAEEAFHEAYMTHTSTSPNYQILATLDAGRRQAELEGYELVQRQLDLAMMLREQVLKHPLLSKYFRFLNVGAVVPAEFRDSGIDTYYDAQTGWTNMEAAWRVDEFALDPTRLTLSIGASGIDGDTFKNAYLMDKYGIQINKTSRNTVLFMTNIGTTRSSLAYLIEVLVKIATEIEAGVNDMSAIERRLHQKRIHGLTKALPPLPDFSSFHFAFRHAMHPSLADTPEGDIRSAFFLSYDEANCEYLTMREVNEAIATGIEVVSALFVIPYPPGFPVLVPGQVISAEILAFMQALDVREIHGYRPELGFRVFTPQALERMASENAGKAAAAVAARAAAPQEPARAHETEQATLNK